MADMIPYMRLYPDDYARDTGHLSTVQHGAYLLLLMAYWNRRGPLPDDDHKLAVLCRLSIREWRRHRPDIEPFFTVQGGTWMQSRVERELELVRSKSLKSKKAGLASVAAKKQRGGNHERVSDVRESAFPSANAEEKDTPAAAADRVLSAWNEMATESGLATASSLTAKRSSSIAARLKDHPEKAILRAIKAIPKSSFLMGKGSARDGKKPWRANFDDMLRPSNMAKLVDGGYHTATELKAAKAPPKPAAPPRPADDGSWKGGGFHAETIEERQAREKREEEDRERQLAEMNGD